VELVPILIKPDVWFTVCQNIETEAGARFAKVIFCGVTSGKA